MSNLVLVHLEIVLVSVQDWCTVYANRTIGQPMVLLGDEAQLKDQFGPFGDGGNIDARWVHGLRRKYHRLGNRFGHSRCNS